MFLSFFQEGECSAQAQLHSFCAYAVDHAGREGTVAKFQPLMVQIKRSMKLYLARREGNIHDKYCLAPSKVKALVG